MTLTPTKHESQPGTTDTSATESTASSSPALGASRFGEASFGPDVGPVVVLDDDLAVCRLIARWVSRRGRRTLELSDGEQLEQQDLSTLGCLCLDLNLPDIDGLKLLERIVTTDPELPVIVITGREDMEAAVASMRTGAYDYIVKPLVQERLELSVQHALERRALTNRLARAAAEGGRTDNTAVIGRSAPMVELARQVRRVIDSEVIVAIRGEAGTGKELVARAIHDDGPRGQSPFVTMNCAAIPQMLHESELFGHERGAVSGAPSAHAGRVEEARGGTLFLDGVEHLSPLSQASLLRAIHDKRASRVGGSAPYDVDTRIICSTRRDLLEEVKAGRFREDLYLNLVVFPLRVPSLRERRDDIPLLVNHFLRKHAAPDRPVKRVAPEVLDTLARYEWPENVRQLENIVHRAVLSMDGDALLVEHLASELREIGGAPAGGVPRGDILGDDDEVIPVRELERRAIKKALRLSGGSVEKAAKLLGMGRATLYRRLAHYDKNGGEL
ncbi:MAG: sigma-54 dependent transcriptional regulator [Deltaproteobacteria bacterium]